MPKLFKNYSTTQTDINEFFIINPKVKKEIETCFEYKKCKYCLGLFSCQCEHLATRLNTTKEQIQDDLSHMIDDWQIEDFNLAALMGDHIP